ncbi:MAG TPA: MBG domain-containing protein, partial [Candidatus Saccharimonadales bacterium]|nr:MBG domain-containing protein [Candidatus Saccharimonadales bacterium]
GNYSISYTPGVLTVTPASLTIAATAQSKTYGQALTLGAGSAQFTPTGLQNGETVGSVTLAASGGSTATGSVSGSPYSITPSAATGGTFTAANYSISYTPGVLTVTTASLSIAANAQSKTYGQALTLGAGSAQFTSTGLQNGETVGSVTLAASGGSTATGSVSGSPYSITPSAATGGTFSPANYSISYTPGVLTVTPASLTITATAQSKTYGQALTLGAGSTSFNTTALQNSETVGSVTIAASGNGNAATAKVSGSPYTLTPSAATGGTFTPANYAITYTPANLTVNPALLTVTATNVSRAYGALNPAFTASYANFVNSETLATSDVAGSPALTSAATNSPVGIYAITNSTGTLTSTNYTFALVNGTLTVTNALSTNSMVSSANPALPGSAVTFTDTVSAMAPSLAVPSGSVQFVVDGAASGAPVTLTNGVAAFTTSTLTHGTHTIVADYVGNTNIAGSTNSVLSELINTAPVAGAVSYTRQANLPLAISYSQLMSHATDADGDFLSLTALSTPTTNGATISISGSTITYTQAASNPNVPDRFTYTVSDTFGATSTGTIVVTILTNTTPVTGGGGSTGVLPNGSVDIGFKGTPGYTYYIQATTNLLGSSIIWTTVSTNVADSNGNINYIDTTATNNVGRYFRTETP